MTSDLSKSLNFNGTIIDSEAGGDVGQQAIIEKMTVFVPSRSRKCSFTLRLPPELLCAKGW